MGTLPEGFRQGIEEFNRGYFFEAHDLWEELWREMSGPRAQFYQGLIQVAVGFYHLGNRNPRGARSQLAKGLAKLDAFQPVCERIDVEAFSREIRRWLNHLQGAEAGEPPPDPAQLPQIRLLPP
jgi:hypothetical protein